MGIGTVFQELPSSQSDSGREYLHRPQPNVSCIETDERQGGGDAGLPVSQRAPLKNWRAAQLLSSR